MKENFKKFSIKHKFLFQIIAPIFTLAASICFNFRKDSSGNIINYDLGCRNFSMQFIWITILVSAVLSYIIFYFGLKNTSDENQSLKLDLEEKNKKIKEISESKSELESEYESLRANYDLFFDRMLTLIATSLKLEGRDRISVYFIPKDEEIFVLKSRFSKNKALIKKSNKNYPFKEGFIYKAIEEGGIIENINADSKNIEDYVSEVINKCNITRERIIALNMKSQSYYIKTIDEDSTETIGLIVLESLDPNKFDKINDNETFNNYSIIIKEFISKHRDRFISNLATTKGF